MVYDGDGGMVGRGAELARLDDALAHAVDGTGRTVVIGGEAGIGKTRLVSALEEQAHGRGVTVLSGACLPAAAGSAPYAPYVEWLRALARSVDPARLPAMLGPAHLAEAPHPGQELAVAGARGRELLRAKQAAIGVDHCRDVDIL